MNLYYFNMYFDLFNQITNCTLLMVTYDFLLVYIYELEKYQMQLNYRVFEKFLYF